MILFGASGHSKVILDILFLNGIEVDYILDDYPKVDHIFNVNVKENKSDENNSKEAIISIGNNEVRKKIAQQFSFRYIKAIHPKSTISKFAEIGDGTVVMSNVSVNPAAIVGKHCILNTASVIEHDCVLEDFVHISPNASLAGNVSIGEGTHVGIGATIIQGIKVGKWCVIGAGAVIIRDIPDFSIVVGNPGKIIKKNNISI